MIAWIVNIYFQMRAWKVAGIEPEWAWSFVSFDTTREWELLSLAYNLVYGN